MNLTHKQIAKAEGVSVVTAYKRYPIERHHVVTQADVLILTVNGFTIREAAKILGISRMKTWRLLNCQ